MTLRLFLRRGRRRLPRRATPSPRLHYADVSAGSAARIARGDFEADRTYWLDRLHDLPPPEWDDVTVMTAPAPGRCIPATGPNSTMRCIGSRPTGVARPRRPRGRPRDLRCAWTRALTCRCRHPGRRPDPRGPAATAGLSGQLRSVPVIQPEETFTGFWDASATSTPAHSPIRSSPSTRWSAPWHRTGGGPPPVFQVMVTTHAALLAGVHFPGIELASRRVAPPPCPHPCWSRSGPPTTSRSPSTTTAPWGAARRSASPTRWPGCSSRRRPRARRRPLLHALRRLLSRRPH